MTRHAKALTKLLTGAADKNFAFDDLVALLQHFGFELRVRGSHHIFTRDGIDEIINLQPKGSLAKPYQVKQVREIVLKYELGDSSDA